MEAVSICTLRAAPPHFLLIDLRHVEQEADSDQHACRCDPPPAPPSHICCCTTARLPVPSQQVELITPVPGPELHLGRVECGSLAASFPLIQARVVEDISVLLDVDFMKLLSDCSTAKNMQRV